MTLSYIAEGNNVVFTGTVPTEPPSPVCTCEYAPNAELIALALNHLNEIETVAQSAQKIISNSFAPAWSDLK